MLFCHLRIEKSIHSTGKRCNIFGNFVDSCNLQDLGYVSSSFTWQLAGTYERLDQALANDSWISAFPHCLMSHLPRIKSDHKSILLRTNSIFCSFIGRPFRFIVNWIKHANCPSFVNDKWHSSGNMANSLSNFTSHVKEWSRFVYDFIGTCKGYLMKSLSNIQRALEQLASSCLLQLEIGVHDELENLLDHE